MLTLQSLVFYFSMYVSYQYRVHILDFRNMTRIQAPVRQGDMQDTRQKRPRRPSICWYKADIQAIITWISKRNKKGIAVNYKAQITGNYTKKTGRLLQEIRPKRKKDIKKKKVADKLANMVKSYKNIRETANRI